SELKQNLKKDFTSFPKRRIALLGNFATQFLAKAIVAYGYEYKINFQIFEAEFDQIERQLFDPGSDLYRSQPEFVILCLSTERLWERFAETPQEDRPHFAAQVLAELQQWWRTIAAGSNAKIIQMNFHEVPDRIFGNYAAKVPSSFRYQLKKLNL